MADGGATAEAFREAKGSIFDALDAPAMGDRNRQVRDFAGHLDRLLASGKRVIAIPPLDGPGQTLETAEEVKRAIEACRETMKPRWRLLDKKVRELAPERWDAYRRIIDQVVSRFDSGSEEIARFVERETRRPHRGIIKEQLARIDAVEAVVADWEAKEVYVVVARNSLALSERVLEAEDAIRTDLPDLLVMVKANPTNRPVPGLVRGELLFARG